MKEQLILGNAKSAGEILSESHESLKSLYEVSCKEIDYIIEKSKLIEGWFGGRIVGGGFGGCSIHLVENKSEENFIDDITNNYNKKFNIVPQIMKVSFPGGLQSM
jgi:galactokinase